MTPLEMQQNVLNATRNHTRYVYSLVNREFFKIDVPATKTNYRIAVIFSGGFRNFDVTMEWANKFLIDPLKADVFYHGWCNKKGLEDNEKTIKNCHNLKSYRILEQEKHPLAVPEVLKSKFPDHVRRGLGMELADHVLGQLFNIKNSFDLMRRFEQENGIKYDIAIRARPDVFWYAPIGDADLDFVVKNSCIATPQGYISIISGGQTNDQFAMAQPGIMETFTRLFDKIPEYGSVAPNDSATEFYVTHHVQAMNVPLHDMDMTFMLDYPSDYPIERGFTNSTMRHMEQNDSIDAKNVTNNILRNR